MYTEARTTDDSKRSIRDGLDALRIDLGDSDAGIRDIIVSIIMDGDANLGRVYSDFGSLAEYAPE